ncbi:thioredoxin family protein [Haloplanus rubicundus]|uniref:Thioredoxin n=1 Tax=Haloplanus rubicundus TaxID=1547898 RepID=A0A345ED18_9EURY|nr:thioredoxin family protein [Haloplanus rubicundus]AXG10090.1 thioredoxin [Haloplanus rubicundus]
MSGPSNAALEDALDALIDAGLVAERDDGGLVTTDAFESTRRVYRDSYAGVDDAVFRSTVADAFGVSESTAAERIDAGSITRADLIAYLSLRAAFDNEGSKIPRADGEAVDSEASETPREGGDGAGEATLPDDERLATMATLVAEISPGSPVPDAVPELDDESWPAFLADHPDAVVTVWRHDCAPCEALKDDLDAVLSALPDAVAVAGVDGESVADFRRTFDVDAAPAVCSFRDGALEDVTTGRQSPDTYADRFVAVYE